MSFSYSEFTKWKGYAVWLLVLANTISGLLTYFGIRDGVSDNSFIHKTFIPLLMTSLSVGIAIYCWSKVFERFPFALPPERKKLLYGIIAVSLVLFSTSTYFAVLGLGGKRAIIHHLDISVNKAGETLSKLNQQRSKEVRLIPSLRRMSELFGGFAGREVDGALSKKQGRGPVFNQTRGIQDGFLNAVKSLEEQEANTDMYRNKGNRLLQESRQIIVSDRTVSEKTSLIEVKLNELNTVFAAMSASAVPTVTAVVERVDKLFAADEGIAVSSAMGKLERSIAESKSLILSEISSLTEAEIPIERFRVINDEHEAIMEHFDFIWPLFIYGVAADLLVPAVLLFFLTLMVPAVRARREDPIPAGEEKDEQWIKSIRSKPELIEKLNKFGSGNGKDKQPPAN